MDPIGKEPNDPLAALIDHLRRVKKEKEALTGKLRGLELEVTTIETQIVNSLGRYARSIVRELGPEDDGYRQEICNDSYLAFLVLCASDKAIPNPKGAFRG